MKTTVKNKHTPGPWRVGARHKNENTLQIPIVKYVSADDPRCSYCVAWVVNSDSINHDSSDTVNANLIAAAPEMLEALKEMLRIAQEQHLPATVIKLKRVIAKAEAKA